MSRPPSRPEALIGKVFTAELALRQGLLTRSGLRTNAWRQLFRGVYADAALPITHRLRCGAALKYLLPPTAVIAGRSATTLRGVGLAGPDDPVEVLLPSGVRAGPIRGLTVHFGDLTGEERARVAGLPTTTPARTAWDLVQWVDPVRAIVLIDRMLAAGLLSGPVLADFADRQVAQRGWRRFVSVVSLVDGRAESPPESELRVRLVLSGLPLPVPQQVIGSARVDLAWPEYRVAVEYDGLWHVGSRNQMNRDRRRLNRLLAEGWLVLHVTSQRMREDLPGIVAEIQSALVSRGCPPNFATAAKRYRSFGE